MVVIPVEACLAAPGQTFYHLLQQTVGLGQQRLGPQTAQGVFGDGHGQFRHSEGTPLNLA